MTNRYLHDTMGRIALCLFALLTPLALMHAQTVYEADAKGNAIGGAAKKASCAKCLDGEEVTGIGSGSSNYLRIKNISVATTGSYTVTVFYLINGSSSFTIEINGLATSGPTLNLTGTSTTVPASTSFTTTFTAGSGNSVGFYNATKAAPAVDHIVVSSGTAAQCTTAPGSFTLSDSSITSSGVTLSWTTPSEGTGCTLTGYTVHIGSNTYSVAAGTTTYTATGLTASTAYSIYVAAVNSDGTTNSNTLTATTSAPTSSTCGTGTSCSWMGYTWNTSASSGVGGGPLGSNVGNISVDSNGYLHLSINEIGGKWYASQMWSKNNFSFGTFQWVLEGDPSLYAFNPDTVFATFMYGPLNNVGVDGADELDLEFSAWDCSGSGCNNGDFTVYPAVYNKDNFSWTNNWDITGPNVVTARMTWTSTSVSFWIMSGVVPMGTTENIITSATYTPTSKATTNIPQVAIPMVFNIYPITNTPTESQQAIIQSFQYSAE